MHLLGKKYVSSPWLYMVDILNESNARHQWNTELSFNSLMVVDVPHFDSLPKWLDYSFQPMYPSHTLLLQSTEYLQHQFTLPGLIFKWKLVVSFHILMNYKMLLPSPPFLYLLHLLYLHCYVTLLLPVNNENMNLTG